MTMYPTMALPRLVSVRLRCAASAVVLSAAMLLGGCATKAVWNKWRARAEISSIALARRASRPDEVQVGWRAMFADHSETTGVLTIHPVLLPCASVEVLVARSSRPPTSVTSQEETFETEALTTPSPPEAIWSRVDDPACKVLLVFRRLAKQGVVAVSASWQPPASLAVESISGPRHPAWLALLPVSVAADMTTGIVVMPVLVCLAMGQDCGKLIEGAVQDRR